MNNTHKLALVKLDVADLDTLEVSSSAFSPEGALPLSATKGGAGVAPPISIRNVPENAKSLALLCEDPDAPRPMAFLHWMVFGLPGRDVTVDAQTLLGAHLGKNSALKLGFAPAAPPVGHGVHHYHFEAFALDNVPEIQDGAGRTEVLEILRGHVIATGDLVGTYEAT